eukprot:jgi/Mesen1/10683/ME000009S10476
MNSLDGEELQDLSAGPSSEPMSLAARLLARANEYAADGESHGADAEPDKMESLDYEAVESDIYRSEQAERGALDAAIYVALKWLLALLLGIGTGVAAFVINVAVENCAGIKFAVTFWLMRYSYLLAFIIYAAFNVALVSTSAFIVTHFAPAAAGSGIPEIKGYLNGVDTPGILLLRTLAGKVLGSVGSVAGGLALGKEGPLVHTGACIASLLGQVGVRGGSRPASQLYFGEQQQQVVAPEGQLLFVTCGAAAGAAAAFRAPVGGVLFALEEVTSWWRSQLMWRVFFTSAIVTVVLRGLMRWCSAGTCGHFSSGGFIIWDVHGPRGGAEVGGKEEGGGEGEGVRERERRRKCTADSLSGTGRRCSAPVFPSGGLFSRVSWIALFLSAPRASEAQRGAFAALCDSALGGQEDYSVFELLPMAMLGVMGGLLGQLQAGRQVLLSAEMRGVVTGGALFNQLSLYVSAWRREALHKQGSRVKIIEASIVALVTSLLSFGMPLLATCTPCPDPAQYPDAQCPRPAQNPGNYVNGSNEYNDLATIFFNTQITNNLTLLPLIMLVLLISKAVGDGFNAGFYDLHAHQRRIPILEAQPMPFMRHFSALEAASKNVVHFERVERVQHVVDTLRAHRHNGYPVMDTLPSGETAFIGLILRRYVTTDFTKPVSSKGMTLDDIELTSEELQMHLDLKPFLNPSPYVVSEDTSLRKVYMLFRQLGLRHLCVVPRSSHVTGILTRKDFMPEVLEERIPEEAEVAGDGSGTVSQLVLKQSKAELT